MKSSYKIAIKLDFLRYQGKPPAYEKKLLRLFRKAQYSKFFLKKIYKVLFILHCKKRHIEFPIDINVQPGLYFGHSFGITVNPKVTIGKNCNIHKNVTIGQENRGKRMGTPNIGDDVYFGVGSTVVGNITIGNDVLIAPGAYVNVDVPSHSIVIGNPAKIIHKDNATESYIENKA